MVNNTEKNEQQAIHYPFSGFYRKLLPTAETDTTEEQTAQVAPMPAPADDTPQNATERAPRWVADVIGEDYKTWGKGKVVIEATTGTGKTSFVMGPLMDWALAETLRMNFPRQMLILCNRRALKADIMAKFEARCEPHIFMNEFGEPDCLEYDIVTIATYQHFEKRLKYTKDKGRALGSYKIIVLDECHYFFDDSSFNGNTAALYQTLKEQEENGLVVWMTATPENMYSVWKRRGQLAQEHYYTLIRKAEHITKAWIYYKDAELIDIIKRALVRNEKVLVMVTKRDKLDSMRALYGDKAAYYCSANNLKGPMDELEDCVRNGKLQKPILFATEALYNGVDIKDETLKHIVIESWVPLKIMQMQGRKRPINADDTCTVYYRGLGAKQIEGLWRAAEHKREPVEAYLQKQKGNPAEWDALVNQDDAKERIKNCPAMEYNPKTGEYDINPMLTENLRQRARVLKQMKEKGYERAMDELVWSKILTIKPEHYMIEGQEEYIREHIGVRMQKEELREALLDIGLYTPTKEPAGMTTLNRALAKYHVKIQSEHKRVREGKSGKTLTYWYMERL